MTFIELMEGVARGFEAVGVAVLVVGLLWSGAVAASVWRKVRVGRDAYRILREGFGGALLLGLEILVAADLIRTIAVAPNGEPTTTLGGAQLAINRWSEVPEAAWAVSKMREKAAARAPAK